MKEFNITPLFYIQIYEQWSQFFKINESLYKFDFCLIKYEHNTMLDRRTIILGFCGFIICFNKNVFQK